MKKILLAAGDRHGLLKVLPLYKALQEHDDYDVVLAAALPLPQGGSSGENLLELFGVSGNTIPVEVTGDTPAGRTAAAMQTFEKLLVEENPGFAVIGGHDDVSLAATLAAAKLSLPVAYIGAGMRDYNRRSQAEINRKLIDTVADIFFVSEHSGEYNLINEGYDEERIFFVGETAIDSLAAMISRANKSAVADDLGIETKKYVLVLLDNADALDDSEALKKMERVVKVIAEKHSVLMLLDPDVATVLQRYEMEPAFTTVPGVQLMQSPGYVEFLRLVKDALFVLTDSSSAQAESTVMKVPCLTMLDDTPSPATIEIGTNVLVGDREEDILQSIDDAFDGDVGKHAKIPEKWDGAVTRRIIEVLEKVL